MEINLEGKKGRENPKKRWDTYRIDNDLEIAYVNNGEGAEPYKVIGGVIQRRRNNIIS